MLAQTDSVATADLAPGDARLRARLSEALDYAAEGLAKLERYAPIWTERKEDDGDAFLRRRDKVAGEALLLAYLASRVPRPDAALAAGIDRLAAACEREIATGRNEALLRRFPQTATTLGLGFVLLQKLGRGRPGIERLLLSALRGGRAAFSERSPYRLMDGRWTFGLLEPGLLGPPDELLPYTTLAASPHPLHTMSADDYALTHALFYLTDFGRRPSGAALGEGAAALLDPFLAWNAVALDYDLLGEFLIAAVALRAPATPALRFAWELVFATWDAEGGLPGPEFSPARCAALAGLEAEAYAFSENYHTRFVGGILCAVALAAARPAPGAEAPARLLDAAEGSRLAERCLAAAERAGAAVYPAPVALPGEALVPEWTAARLLQVLETPAEPLPMWLRQVAAGSLERGECAQVLHDALLVGSARRYRLVQLAQALAAAAGRPELRSPTLARALEFLLAQQLDDGSIGIHRLLAESNPEGAAAAAEATAGAQSALAGLLRRVGTELAR